MNELSEGLNYIIDIVIEGYGKYNAGSLIDLTDEEEPWKNTEINMEITQESIKNYFERVYGDVLFWTRELEWNGANLNENRIFLINQANDEICRWLDLYVSINGEFKINSDRKFDVNEESMIWIKVWRVWKMIQNV